MEEEKKRIQIISKWEAKKGIVLITN